jgi:hypothetical protein
MRLCNSLPAADTLVVARLQGIASCMHRCSMLGQADHKVAARKIGCTVLSKAARVGLGVAAGHTVPGLV